MIEQAVSIDFNRMVCKDIWLIGFRSEPVCSIAGSGQFLMIRVEDNTQDPLLRRPFSIHRTGDQDTLTILYKVVGKGTALLSGMKKGDSLSIIGPLGKGFPMPRDDRQVVVVGGGMGIAPLCFLIQELSRRKKTEVKIFLGFSGFQEAVLAYRITEEGLEAEIATEDGSVGVRGMVTDLLEKYLEKGVYQKPVIYACGPVEMLKRIALRAMESKMECYVSLEAGMACGMGLCKGCAVRAGKTRGVSYYYICQDGPVFSAPMIDWGAL